LAIGLNSGIYQLISYFGGARWMFHGIIPFHVAAVFWGVCGALLVERELLLLTRKVFVFPGGFVHYRWPHFDACPWNQVRRAGRYQTWPWRKWGYIVERDGGRVFQLDDRLDDDAPAETRPGRPRRRPARPFQRVQGQPDWSVARPGLSGVAAHPGRPAAENPRLGLAVGPGEALGAGGRRRAGPCGRLRWVGQYRARGAARQSALNLVHTIKSVKRTRQRGRREEC
jgi:hypothetical protein